MLHMHSISKVEHRTWKKADWDQPTATQHNANRVTHTHICERTLMTLGFQASWTTVRLLGFKIAFPPLLSSFTFHLPSGCIFITVPIWPFLSFKPLISTRDPSTSASSTLGGSTTLARMGHPPSGALDFFASTSSLSFDTFSGICNAFCIGKCAAVSLGIHPPPVPAPAVGDRNPCLLYSSINAGQYHSGGSILDVVIFRIFEASATDRSASGVAFPM